MRPFLAVAATLAGLALALPAAAQDASVASDDAPVREVYTAWGHDFELFMGTEGPVNPSTGARPCSTGPCGWAAGLHVPSGAKILSVEFSACDGDATQELNFFLLRSPKVPGDAEFVVPYTGTGVPEAPGCTTFTAAPATPEIVDNTQYAYVFVVNSAPGTNMEWNQFRATYRGH